jgi:hypothetical protein
MHLLVLPKAHIPNVSSLTASDVELGKHNSSRAGTQDGDAGARWLNQSF